jgi:hypothetical protein
MKKLSHLRLKDRITNLDNICFICNIKNSVKKYFRHPINYLEAL